MRNHRALPDLGSNDIRRCPVSKPDTESPAARQGVGSRRRASTRLRSVTHLIREDASTLIVAALSSAFGVALLAVTAILTQIIRDADIESETLSFILSFIAVVFVAIALYVGAVVTSNTVATIVAGRTRTIALLRLIGSSASAQRRAVAIEGLVVGAVGSVIGCLLGIGATAAIVQIGQVIGFIPAGRYPLVDASAVLPVLAVTATTFGASWVGSRRVLRVSPMEATGAAVESTLDSQRGRRARNVSALVVHLIGDLLLVAGVIVGLSNPLGVLIGLVGGILSFTGVVLAASVVMPVALDLVGRLFGRSPTARLARANAVRYPERSARMTVGLVIGVTLITTLAVTLESFQFIISAARAAEPETYQGVGESLQIAVAVFSVLIGFAGLIAAVGMVNNLSLNVLQRTREIGLLRALGFTARQIRRTILVESAQLTVAAVVVGLVLGVFYGWVGAQSLLGGVAGSPGLVVPAVPVLLLVIVVGAAAVLALTASVVPSRRATRVSPVEALRG